MSQVPDGSESGRVFRGGPCLGLRGGRDQCLSGPASGWRPGQGDHEVGDPVPSLRMCLSIAPRECRSGLSGVWSGELSGSGQAAGMRLDSPGLGLYSVSAPRRRSLFL